MATEDSICGTHVTIDEIREAIQNHTGIQSALSNWSAIEIGAGKGFLSVMAKLQFEWVEKNVKLPKTAILKIPTLNKLEMLMGKDNENMIETFKTELFKIHNAEVSVYEAFADKPPTKLPQIWGMKRLSEHGIDNHESAYILMEDLSEQSTHWDLMMCQKLTVQQTKVIIEELAKVHAWSVINPTLCAKIEVMDMKAFIEKMDVESEKNMKKFQEAVITKKWVNELGADALAHKELFFAFNYGMFESALTTVHLKHHLPNTLFHGDVHVNNMLWAKDKDGKPSDQLQAFIDWQVLKSSNSPTIVSIGNPMYDVCRLLNWLGPLSNRSIAGRESLLRIYYDKFSALLKANGQSITFDFDQLKACFWETSLTVGAWIVVDFSTFFIEQLESGQVSGVADPSTAGLLMLKDICLMYKDVLMIKKEKQI